VPGAELFRVVPTDLLWRVYRVGGRHATTWRGFRTFGPTRTARFDHHPNPPGNHTGYGVLYAALDAKTAVAEAFGDRRVIDRQAERPYLSAFRVHVPVQVLDLTSDWLTRAGGSQSIASGPRPSSQAWSRAIHAELDVAGLRYASSMRGGGTNIALYERAEAALEPLPEVNLPLDHRALHASLLRWARDLGYGFV
jgi:hypothetical protein